MTDFREFPKSETRQIIDYNRFMSLTGNKIFLCLDKGIIEIARYLLNSRGSWRSTYVKEYVGTIGYNMPTQEEFENVLNAIAEANIDMASCDEIVDALNGIRAEISQQSSTGGCGCIGSGGDLITDVLDEPSDSIPGGSSYPSGFSSRAEYDTYRCKAAYWIIDKYINTLRNWAGMFGVGGGLTLALVTALLLLIVPPAGLMIIVAALGVLIGIDIGLLSDLSSIADGIEDDRDQLACDVYNAASAQAARDVIANKASDVIDGLSLSIPDTYKQITDNLISVEQCNILANNDPEIDALPEEDCSACVGDCDGDVYQPVGQSGVWGEVTSWDGTTLTGNSELGDTAQRFNWRFAIGEDPCCREIVSIELAGSTHPTAFDFYTPCGSTEFVQCPGDTAENLVGECIHALLLASDTSFTVSIVFTSNECFPE